MTGPFTSLAAPAGNPTDPAALENNATYKRMGIVGRQWLIAKFLPVTPSGWWPFRP